MNAEEARKLTMENIVDLQNMQEIFTTIRNCAKLGLCWKTIYLDKGQKQSLITLGYEVLDTEKPNLYVVTWWKRL